ncbi:MAG: hypothetical protein RQ867_05110 [Mariprofundaceae bacterium]|nr:hypothetical protein [Mariprofundaceae bacterium]
MEEEQSFTASEWLRLIATVVWLIVFIAWPQLTASITLLTAGSVMIAYNALIFRSTVVRKEEASSLLPFVGGVIAAVGIALLPLEQSWKWAWIPLLIDWGGLPLIWFGWREMRSK